MNLIHPPETELICDEIFRNRKNAKYFQAYCQVFASSMYTFGTKIRLISKSMTPQTGKQIIVMHILPNISRSQGIQRNKFDRLIGYNLRKVFLERSYRKCGGGNIPKPFF